MGVWHSIAQQKKAQAGRSRDLADAAAALALMDIAGLTAQIYPPRPRTAKGKVMGRPAYSRQAIVHALLLVAHPAVDVPNVAALIRHLRNNPALRAVCSFDGKIPSEQVFCEVYKWFSENADLVMGLFVGLTNRVKDVCPDFGKVIAVDSTTVSTHCNPNRRARRVSDAELARYAAEDEAERQKAVAAGKGDRWRRRIRKEETSDPEASWTRKNQASAPGGKQWVFGYKAHTLCDAETGLPIAVAVTTASQNDSPMLLPLVDDAMAAYSWFQPEVCAGDRGYDGGGNYAGLLERGVAPALRKRDLKDGKLHYGVYTGDGVPTCKDGVPLDYVRTDEDTGHYVYRLSADCVVAGGDCLRRKVRRSIKGYQVCDDEVWVDPQADVRLFGYPCRRGSPEWLEYSVMRGSVERMYSVWKGSSGLERHCYRGLAKVRAKVLLTAIMRQAMGLLELRRASEQSPADGGLAAAA